MRPHRLLRTVLFAAVVAGGACGDDGSAVSEPIPEDPDVLLVAEDMAFELEHVEVRAGEPVTIVIDNRDDGVNHNVHVLGAPEPNKTPLRLGPSRQALTVTLEAGEHQFICDLHPFMAGTIRAS